MIIIQKNATDEVVMDIVLHWVDVLAGGDYEKFADAVGYSFAGRWTPEECIRAAIVNYRSPDFYPDIDSFLVSNWREAQGGNPNPKQEINWYVEHDSTRLVGAISFDLPLNGKWSDLRADFVFLKRNPHEEGYILRLEEIFSWRQRGREYTADND
jgi:hypothetical protein